MSAGHDSAAGNAAEQPGAGGHPAAGDAAQPVLFVTNYVAPDRAPALQALHAREGIELALFGGRSHHFTGAVADPGVPHRQVTERDVFALAASGRYRAVIAGTAGRIALPAAYAGSRRARVPFLLWSALWHQPLSPAHAAGAVLLERLYRDADAIVAYGPHVAAYARRRGSRNVHEALQAVDNVFWNERIQAETRSLVVFVGRPMGYKGAGVLVAAWRASGLDFAPAALVLVGVRLGEISDRTGGAVRFAGAQPPHEVRNFYARAAVVVIPSLATRTFREPWALVANEAMNQRTPIIATDAVGAAAGGLVRDGRNGLIVPAGDAGALAAALRRLLGDDDLRARMGAAAERDVAPYTFAAWAGGFARALDSVGAARS